MPRMGACVHKTVTGTGTGKLEGLKVPDYLCCKITLDIFRDLCCKITLDIFRDSVITHSRVTYERSVILGLLTWPSPSHNDEQIKDNSEDNREMVIEEFRKNRTARRNSELKLRNAKQDKEDSSTRDGEIKRGFKWQQTLASENQWLLRLDDITYSTLLTTKKTLTLLTQISIFILLTW
ncbi:hypothetical protein POM88_047503 [Heracleum sosnowskyi]|uniref:RING-type E3 ubiquitin transferase n=1 Tax=Heracleum sosnowskyi TaxID=360622 RepID=A0AAD8GSA3_9APIA|nr:hypothetical protein POM88_047503 [Heracleum sosnowskyi]